MSDTFGPSLPTSLDLVRFLIGDTDMAHAQLSDDTITALLTLAVSQGASAAGAPYCAAATAGETILARRSVAAAGIVSKTVSKLSISRGSGAGSDAAAYREYLTTLKATCTSLSLSAPALLRAW